MGSLTVIMVVFMVTAILVKVEIAPLPFFVVTMIKICIINCECRPEAITPFFACMTNIHLFQVTSEFKNYCFHSKTVGFLAIYSPNTMVCKGFVTVNS